MSGDENRQRVRYRVDPCKAEGLRQSFTLAAFGLGTRSPSTADAASQLDGILDRSHVMPAGRRSPQGRE